MGDAVFAAAHGLGIRGDGGVDDFHAVAAGITGIVIVIVLAVVVAAGRLARRRRRA